MWINDDCTDDDNGKLEDNAHDAIRLSTFQGLYSLGGKTSYRQMSWSLEAARLDVIVIVSFWKLTGISAAVLTTCMSNCRAIGDI